MLQHGEDRFVHVRIEIVGAHDLADDAHDLAIDEYRPDECHFRLEVLRRYTIDYGKAGYAHGRAELLRRVRTARLVDFLWRVSARNAWSIEAIGITSIPARERSISRIFSFGSKIARIPACRAAYSFSTIPPTGRTMP